jgi:hypothetical protein
MSICKYYGVEHSASLCMFCNSNLPAQQVIENKIAELEEEIVSAEKLRLHKYVSITKQQLRVLRNELKTVKAGA